MRSPTRALGGIVLTFVITVVVVFLPVVSCLIALEIRPSIAIAIGAVVGIGSGSRFV